MRRNEAGREAVEASSEALLSLLGVLADELSKAIEPRSYEDSNDAAGVGSEIKESTTDLARALSQWLPEIPANDELDAFLYELASRNHDEVFDQAADAVATMLEFLRQISYGSLPNLREAPDAQDVGHAMSELLVKLGVQT